MGFKMKSVNEVLNLHATSNHLDNVIKEVDMPKGVWGWISQDKSISINKNLNKRNKSETITHEKKHRKQMELGKSHIPKLQFDDNYYKWTPHVGGPTHIIPTDSFDTRDRRLPWEWELTRRRHHGKHKRKKAEKRSFANNPWPR